MKPFKLLSTALDWVIENASGPTTVDIAGLNSFGESGYAPITVDNEYGTWEFSLAPFEVKL